jgi:hypothetical protein
MPQLTEQPVGRPLERPAADQGRHGDDVVPARRDRVADARHRHNRADGDDGIGGRHHHDLGAGDGGEDTRRGLRRLGPGEAHAGDRHGVLQPHEVVLKGDLLARRHAHADHRRAALLVGQGDHRPQRVLGRRHDP